jgi:thiol-disulfide isomerase/thioredoxin
VGDILFFAAAVILIGVFQTRGHVRGESLPPLQLESLDGARVDLSNLKGQPTLISFWAPWCGVCGATSKNVSRAMHWAGTSGRVVSIALSYRDRAQVEKYVIENSVDYPVWFGPDELEEKLHITSFPTIYFVDRQGRISGSAVGYTTTLGLLFRLWWNA